MNHDYFRKLQKDFICKVVKILREESRALGILLYGSIATGKHDAFSDIDLICYLTSKDKSVIDDIFTKIEQVHPVLSKLWLYDRHALFLFTNGVRLDLDLLGKEELPNLYITNHIILYDPFGEIARKMRCENEVNSPAHPKHFQPGDDLPNWFFWMFRQVYCWIKRGNQNSNKSFDKLFSAFHSLNEMRQYLIDMRKWCVGVDGYLQDIDPEFASRLYKTFTPLEPSELLNATRLILSEYEYVCKGYCEKCNIPYPQEKVEIIKRIFDTFDSME